MPPAAVLTLVSLTGGADDTWASTEDVTEEDFVLRSVWVTVGRSMGQGWLAGWWQPCSLAMGIHVWISALALCPHLSTPYLQNSTFEVHPAASLT